MSDVMSVENSDEEFAYEFSDQSDDDQSGEGFGYSDEEVGGSQDVEEKGVEILNLSDLKAKYDGDVRQICDMLRIPYETGVMAMRQFNWDAHRIMDTWCSDPDAVRRKVGVVFPDCIPPALPDAQRQCPICFTDKQERDMISAGCSHFVCRTCWRQYLEVNINEKQKVMCLGCPALGDDGKACKAVVPRSVLTQVADEPILEKLADYDDALVVETNSRVSWCPQPNCRAVAMVDGPVPKYPMPLDVTCKCGGTFCFTCKQEAHRPVDCETVKQWNIKNSAESENLTWIIANTKPCPKCQRPIEKNQGCMHMTCSQCRHEFCWLCKAPWSEHGDGTGGFYACNRYEQGLREGKFSAEEMRRKAARESLERYTHFYERFHAHDVSRKEAIRLLQDSVSEHLRKVSSTTQKAEPQLKFIIEAHRQVAECRRILKWTYAYGYYRFDTLALDAEAPDDEEAEDPQQRAAREEAKRDMNNRKKFFEFLQGDAESALERLSDTLEKDLVRYYNPTEFWREKQGDRPEDDDLGVIMRDFQKTEHDIVNQTNIARQFFGKLVKQLESGLEGMLGQYAQL